MTADSNSSAKASRYKWEPHRDTNGQCQQKYFQPAKDILLQNYRSSNGRHTVILFGSGVNVTLLMSALLSLSYRSPFDGWETRRMP